jgi:hypothetical protein
MQLTGETNNSGVGDWYNKGIISKYLAILD